jgi:PAS domain S-box-containing protein
MSAGNSRSNGQWLSEFAERFRALREAVLVLDERGYVADANPAASELFATSVSSLRDRHVRELVNLNGHTPDVGISADAARTDRPLQLSAWRAGGDEFSAEVTLSPYAAKNGEGAATVIVIRDLSDRKRIADIIAHRERLATVGEATARVVHNLRNTLTGITTLADSLLEATETWDRDSLELIQAEAQRAAAMLCELLDFSRRDSTRPLISLNEIVERAAQLSLLRDQSFDFKIVKAFCDEPALVLAGAGQLEQAVLNLLDNARHAVSGREAGRVTVSTWVDGNQVNLSVADNGCGIPEELLTRVFDPFFTTKDPGVGTGLGLAIVESTVREFGGAIAVSSEPGRGTTFIISFPRAA